MNLDDQSLYEALEQDYGMRPTRARLTVEAIPAGERHARLLGLEPGEPLLLCRQQSQDQVGRQIELCDMVYRGDRYRFRAMLERGS
jgi:GntR family transcriptional regulator